MLSSIKPSSIKQMPTSFKTIEVAKGNANLFLCPRNITMNVWNLCAPSIILTEAGGKLTNLYGEQIDFQNCVTNKDGIIASNGGIHDYIVGSVAKVLNSIDKHNNNESYNGHI